MPSTDPTRRCKLFCHTSTTTRTAIMQTRSPKLGNIFWIFIYHGLVERHGLASQTKGRNLRFVCERPAKFLIVDRYWHWCIIVLDRTMAEYLCRNKLQMIKDKVILKTGYNYVICFWKSSPVRFWVISKAGMLLNSLVMQSTYCVVLCYFEEFPVSRENICPKKTLRHFEDHSFGNLHT